MAYQNPAFYFYHSARESQDASGVPAPSATSPYSIFDDRQGEVFTFEGQVGGFVEINSQRPQTAEASLVDTLIISGHNWDGLQMLAQANDTTGGGGTVGVISLQTISVPNGEPIFLDASPTDALIHDQLEIDVFETSAPWPELTEMWWTQKRELTRGPVPGWDHSWARTQHQFTSQSGVTSTWLTGANRKRFRMTWRALSGDDRQVFLDMREQTDGWSRPFWMRPPDDIYETRLYELDRDSDWQQDLDDPLTSGTADQITMPMIEVLG
jgi:hypothetical protein